MGTLKTDYGSIGAGIFAAGIAVVLGWGSPVVLFATASLFIVIGFAQDTREQP